MIDPVSLQMARDFVAILGVGIGLVYCILNINHQRETRQTQTFLQLYSRMIEPEHTELYENIMSRDWDDLEDYLVKYRSSRSEFFSIQTFFEGIGVLLKKGVIDGDLVYEMIPTNASAFWAKYKPVAEYARETLGISQYMRSVEYLANEMNRIAQAKGDPIVTEYRWRDDG